MDKQRYNDSRSPAIIKLNGVLQYKLQKPGLKILVIILD
ncbi:hypothetical protein ASZ90_020294 [hydrocarbon metagenome]|uniref:Uncharacterized protein n=1 Tax=hydrocarbon metagenome TaxID=938273 RepID=A0A0W8E161_9ZZZZ